MPFDVQGARSAGYSDKEIADHLAKDSAFDLSGARKAGYSDSEIIGHLSGGTPAAPAAAEQPSSGILDTLASIPGHIKEAITGEKRSTKETESLPDWGSMPELNSFSVASAKTGLGTLLSNPAETVQVIQSNFPGVQVRQDDKGNYLLRSSIDGKEYAIKPGFRASDIPRAAGGIAAFTPAGRASTIAGAGLKAAATQAAIEGTQAATGGAFNPGDVAAAGVTGAVIPAIGSAVRAAAAPAKQILQRLRGTPNPIATTEPAAVADTLGAASAPSPHAVPPASILASTEPAVMSGPDLVDTARKAAQGGIGSKSATQVLAEQAAPDAKAVEAAKRLGIEDYLQPDHVTTNQAYRELAQAVKSIPGSEARAAELEGIGNVAKRANDLVEEIGGTHDISTLSGSVKNRMLATQSDLDKQAEDLYAKVKAAIPAKTEAPAINTLDFLKQYADDLGGASRLLAPEKKLLSSLSGGDGPVTYAFLDQTRKQIGQAMRKASGPFSDSEAGMLKKLYGTLSADQQAVADANGAGQIFNAAKSSVAVRKGLEDDLSALFGKNLDESFVGDLSGAFKSLPAGDPTKFIRMVKAIPENMRQEVVASGLNTAFGKSAANGNVSFAKYANWYEGLVKNKQSYTALMSNLPPAARKQLSDLYRVSRGISAASKERIVTGRLSAIKDELKPADTLVGRLYDIARQSALGATVGTAVSTVAGPGAGAAVASALAKGAKSDAIKAVDKLITSSEFVDLAKKAAQGAQPEQRRATLRLVHSAAWKRFAHAAKQPTNPTAAERWIVQALQNDQQR
jgi:hypothetical protein